MYQSQKACDVCLVLAETAVGEPAGPKTASIWRAERCDGFSVDSYEADGEGFAKRGIAAYKPVLTRFPSVPATARADSGSEDT